MPPTLHFLTEFSCSDTLHIRPWPDEILDTLGFDPRSAYVESYWLGVLGPSTTWLVRRLVTGLEQRPDGYPISLSEDRTVTWGLSDRGASEIAVRAGRHPDHQVRPGGGRGTRGAGGAAQGAGAHPAAGGPGLPPTLQAAHHDTGGRRSSSAVPSGDLVRRRGRLLALSMIEMGDDLEGAEHRLLELRYHPALAYDAAGWACASVTVASPWRRRRTDRGDLVDRPGSCGWEIRTLGDNGPRCGSPGGAARGHAVGTARPGRHVRAREVAGPPGRRP